MLQTTNDDVLSTQATENKKNPDIPSGIARTDSDGISGSIENPLTVVKSVKSKKLKLTQTKKSDLVKS